MYEEYETYRAQCTKTTPEQREKNLNKGCVIPADGKKKRCVIKVVKTDYKKIIIKCTIICVIIFCAILLIYVNYLKK